MEMIPISTIKIDNPYLRFNTNIDELKESIKTVGLIGPLVINKENKLVAGGRRFSAIKELGWDKVPCIRIDEDGLKEELISIDENLVRQNLSDVELENCLRRGKEIYETLYPEYKEEITLEDLKPKKPKKKLSPEELEEELDDAFVELKKNTFVQNMVNKTGMSETAIKRAILRDKESSHSVREARVRGDIGASQVNEIIRLKKETQDEILPFIRDKASHLVKEIVKDVEKHGLDAALEKTANFKPITKEFIGLKNMSRRMNRAAIKILSLNEMYDGPEKDEAINELIILKDTIDELIQSYQ